MKKLVLISSLLFAVACGDNNDGNNNDNPDAGPGSDAAPVDGPPADTAPGFTFTAPYPVPLSAMGPDQIQALAAAPNGAFYYAGFAAQSSDPAAAQGAGLKAIFVGKTGVAGPDFTFGNIPNSGVALVGPTNMPFVTPTGSADEIDLAVQSDGKILVSFSIANTIVLTDNDVAVARILPATGALDTTFGVNGIARIDFSTKGLTTVADGARGLAVDSANNIYVHATALRPGGTDADFALAKLTADGQLYDGVAATPGWGTGDSGKFFFDLVKPNTTPAEHLGATPRGVIPLADGSVIAGGYIANGVTAAPQPALYKLDASGDLETDFNTVGFFHDTVLPVQTEVYNFALHGTKIVTGGYGRSAGETNDFVSMRFDTVTGVRDTTWGGTTNGVTQFDPSGTMAGSNCRNAVALPNGKTLLIGSTGASNAAAQDAVFAVLDADGKLDTKYGSGVHKLPFSSTADQNDQFWAAAVSGNNVMIAGWRGTATSPNVQTAANNDNSYLISFTLQ